MFRKLRLLSFLLLAAVYSGYAQAPSPIIVATPTSGCAPLAISFNDGGTGATSWNWSFPGGVPNSSTTKNNAVQYLSAGTYTATLTATNANGSTTATPVTITVNPVPTADFTQDKTTGCYPTTVQFTDATTTGPGETITSRTWNYGDGTQDLNILNPSHVYTSAGSFGVILYVKNNFNCTGSAQVKNVTKAITITGGITPDFNTSLNSSCTLPVTANFTNSTSGPGTVTYSWDFGDGGGFSNNSINPTHDYLAAGSYTVKLAATSNQGCTDTLPAVVNISASGNLSDFTGAGNVCVNTPTNFPNTSSPPPNNSVWDYGDGTPPSPSFNGLHVYTTPGTYNVTLTNTFSGCNGTVTKQVNVVTPPTTAFTATNINSCKAPLTTQFTDQTVGATSWLWNFGDGSPTSTLQNPMHTYNTLGNFNVTLTTGTAGNCTNTLTKNTFVNIVAPAVLITNAPAYGCAPFSYTPTISVTAVDGVASYAWDFGNGNTFNGLTPPPQIYAAGVYTVTITITTNGGCTAVGTGTVKVGTVQPATAFNAVPTSTCVSSPIQFNDLTPPGTSNQWLWDFGDGSTSTLENPVHSYSQPGTYDVTLTAYNNGCFQKLTKTAYITINPPLAAFNYSFACGAKTNYTFTDNSIGALTWDWDFGDGTMPHGSTANVTHTYATMVPTLYNVTLKVTNGGCTNTITKQINVNQSTIISTPKNPVCNNTTITIFTTAPSNIVGYIFIFGDGTPNAPSGSGATTHTYATAGTYLITVQTTDNNGCVETSAPYTMNISGPTVKFTTPTLNSCGPLAAVFTDQSTASGGSTLTSWKWDFGDGGTATGQGPLTHNYNFQGIFPVKLKVTDNIGCSDSLIKPSYIAISLQNPKFTVPDSSCPTKNIKFTNLSTGGISPVQYSWDFGDGNPPLITTSPTSPLYSYAAVGKYAVKLTMKDSYGCINTFTGPDSIVIDVPVSTFNMSGNYSACPPFNVAFTFTGSYAQTYLWDFNDGNSSTLMNASDLYANPGDYYPTLTIVSPGGCIATSPSQHIHIDGPIGTFTYSPLAACDSLDVNFQVTTTNVISFVWNFGDGSNLITTTTPSISHHYNIPGQYTPIVTLTDVQGCVLPKIGANPINVDAIGKAIFKTSTNVVCDTGTVNFTDTSMLSSGTVINNYVWNFGDGTLPVSGMYPTLPHFYSAPGVYNATMNITTVGGCTGGYAIPVTVAASPQVAINGLISQCEPAILNFSGTELVPDPNGPLTWSWDFGNGQTGTGQNPPAVSYPKAGEYVVQLIATNSKGCKDTTDTSTPSHLFIYPIPSVNAGVDTTICLGTPLQLNATGTPTTTYNWDPPVTGTLSCLPCNSPIANSPSSTYFVVNGTSIQGCQSRDTIQVTVNTPVTLIVSGPDSVCVGQPAQLSATGAAIYTWTPSQGLNNPNIANPTATPDASQIGGANSAVINYQVTGYDSKRCFSDTKSVDITAFNYPVIDLIPNATINVGGSYQISSTAAPNIVSLSWTPSNTLSCSNCLTPVATPTKTTKYSLTAINDGGCATTGSIQVQVICNGANFFVPNSFSPNGDGVNDYFIVNGVGLNVIPSLTIYNRWGQIVFQKSNFTPNTTANGWDGTFNGKPAPSDVYVYTIQILCDNATLIPYHGNLTLIR